MNLSVTYGPYDTVNFLFLNPWLPEPYGNLNLTRTKRAQLKFQHNALRAISFSMKVSVFKVLLISSIFSCLNYQFRFSKTIFDFTAFHMMVMKELYKCVLCNFDAIFSILNLILNLILLYIVILG